MRPALNRLQALYAEMAAASQAIIDLGEVMYGSSFRKAE